MQLKHGLPHIDPQCRDVHESPSLLPDDECRLRAERNSVTHPFTVPFCRSLPFSAFMLIRRTVLLLSVGRQIGGPMYRLLVTLYYYVNYGAWRSDKRVGNARTGLAGSAPFTRRADGYRHGSSHPSSSNPTPG